MIRQWKTRYLSHIFCHNASAYNIPTVLGTTHLALIIFCDYTSSQELQAPHWQSILFLFVAMVTQ